MNWHQRSERRVQASGHGLYRRAALGVVGCAALGVSVVAPVASAASSSSHHAAPALRATALPASSVEATTPSVVAASCPRAPKAPRRNTNYAVNGLRWDPKDTIKYEVDTARLRQSQVKARVSDARRAMREAAKYSGLIVSYRGTESKLKNATKEPFLVQFEYSNLSGGRGVAVSPYVFVGTHQMFGAVVDIQSTTSTGYGRYDTRHPEHSAEGHLLLFGVGGTFGLKAVKTSDRQVMNPHSSKRFYYESYQGGDKYGLYKVGASRGCGGFRH